MSKHHSHDSHDSQGCNCHAVGRRSFLGLAAAAAGLAIVPVGRAWAAKTEIVIGGTLPLTGPFVGLVQPFPKLSDAWAERVNQAGGIKLSKEGRSLPVRFVYYDDKTSPPEALKLYERLATVDKVDLFIGPYSSFLTNAALQATAQHHLPFFMVEANDEALFEKPNPWRVTGLAPARTEYDRITPLYDGMGDMKTVALLGRENLHERQAVEGAADNFRKMGKQVVYEQLAPKDTKDFSSIILAMKQANPDVVLVEALPPPWTIGFLKQARELGLNPKEMIAGHVGLPVVKSLGSSGDNITSFTYYFDGDTADHQELYAIAKAAGVEPWMQPETGMRYRAFRRIKDALERAGTLDREAVRKAMWETDLTLYGEEVVKHDERGYGTDKPYPTQIRDGSLVSLWPLAAGRKKHRAKDGKW